jgi:hypothetical protein
LYTKTVILDTIINKSLVILCRGVDATM